jgi:hypothetical protein
MNKLHNVFRTTRVSIWLLVCILALTATSVYAEGHLRPQAAVTILGAPDAAVLGKFAVGTASPGNKALTVAGVIDFVGAGTVHNYFTQGPGNNMQIRSNVDEFNSVGDTSKSQWNMVMGSALDVFSIRRSPSGGAYNEDALFFIDGASGRVGIATVDTSNGATIPFTPFARLHVETASGTAIRGVSNATTGSAYGVYGRSASTSGYGVYGRSDGTSGKGVYGESQSTSGRGVYGSAPTYGVVGNASATSGANYGVYGWSDSTSGHGVYGSGYYGVEGSSDSTSGHGVSGAAIATSGTNYGVRGASFSSSGYDFYAAGAGTNYGPFTGAHEVRLSTSFPAEVKAGMIVSATGEAQIRQAADGSVDLSSTLPTVKLSDTAEDKAVFGVLVAEVTLPDDHWYEAEEKERFASVNALGEGRVWVTDLNGDIEAGDYITTSILPGYGQRQNDCQLNNYTLGKATETVDWNTVTKTVEYNGQEYKVYLLAVVYTSG